MSRREYYEEQKIKKIVYTLEIVLILSVVLFLSVVVIYNRKMKQSAKNNLASIKESANIVPNDDIEETSFSKDLTVSNAVNNTVNTVSNERKIVNTTPVQAVVENKVEEPVVEKKKEIEFIAPVSGEIMKDFAMDTLIYSNTLEEWTTHSGIDIKGEKTSIVVASEDGIVESIKSDPRFGLTITIKHGDEFKTVYSNLLTSEFVEEGEEVEKGQTIGTIGDSASFEILDEPHLHFEIIKNGENVNPTIYLK